MKYFGEFFVPYDSFFETSILLTSKSCKLNSFLFLLSYCSFFFFAEKNVKKFYINFECLIYSDKN